MHSVSIQALMLLKSQFIINKQKIPMVVTLLSIVLQIFDKLFTFLATTWHQNFRTFVLSVGEESLGFLSGSQWGFEVFLTAQCNKCLYMNNVGGSDWKEWLLEILSLIDKK